MVHLLLAVIYISFITLGLPDALLGAAWPSVYRQFQVPVSYAGIISMIIAFGTIVSSLQSGRLTKWLGTGKVTVLSVAITCAAMFGFSISGAFWQLCLWAVPYGLGAGCVDASLNNYVALHYASRHMSWLHCMWGVGASAGPYIMGFALARGLAWNMGYRYIGVLQLVLTAVLLFSLPLWRKPAEGEGDGAADSLTLLQILRIPGAKQGMTAFFCYSALEQTAGLWAASYMVLRYALTAERATWFASLFFLGITVGRAVCGFLTLKLNDVKMVRLGLGCIAAGVLVLFLPLGENAALPGLLLVGTGCAPILPCLLHATPEHFGAERSQAIIGVQMACSYAGILVMPPLFGLIAQYISVSLFPAFLLGVLILMAVMHETLLRKFRQE